MIKARKLLLTIVGLAQNLIGGLGIIFAYLFYYDFLDGQTLLNTSEGLLPIYLLILVVSSFFSILNGFFLIYESLVERS